MPTYRIIWKDGTSEVIEADTEVEARAKARYARNHTRGEHAGPIDHVERGSVRTEQSTRGFHRGGG